MKTHIYNGKEYLVPEVLVSCSDQSCTSNCSNCLKGHRQVLALTNYLAVNCYDPQNNLVEYGLLTEEGKERLRKACDDRGLAMNVIGITQHIIMHGGGFNDDCVYRPAPKPEIIELTKEEALKIIVGTKQAAYFDSEIFTALFDFNKIEEYLTKQLGKTVKIKEGV